MSSSNIVNSVGESINTMEEINTGNESVHSSSAIEETKSENQQTSNSIDKDFATSENVEQTDKSGPANTDARGEENNNNINTEKQIGNDDIETKDLELSHEGQSEDSVPNKEFHIQQSQTIEVPNESKNTTVDPNESKDIGNCESIDNIASKEVVEGKSVMEPMPEVVKNESATNNSEDNINNETGTGENLKSYSDDEVEIDHDLSSDSSSSSDSSDNSSDSDDSDDDSDGSEVKDSIGDDDEDDDEIKGPIVSKNEIMDEKAPTLPENYSVPDNAPLQLVGQISSLVDRSVIIKANTSGEFRILKENSVLCLKDRQVIGLLFETFGRLQAPFYRVKFNSEDEFATFKDKVGEEVFYVVPDSQFLYTETIKSIKGTDASNCHDEELPEEEQEFSDDEAEMAAKSKKKKRKNRNNNNNNNNNNPEKYKKLKESETYRSYGYNQLNAQPLPNQPTVQPLPNQPTVQPLPNQPTVQPLPNQPTVQTMPNQPSVSWQNVQAPVYGSTNFQQNSPYGIPTYPYPQVSNVYQPNVQQSYGYQYQQPSTYGVPYHQHQQQQQQQHQQQQQQQVYFDQNYGSIPPQQQLQQHQQLQQLQQLQRLQELQQLQQQQIQHSQSQSQSQQNQQNQQSPMNYNPNQQYHS